MKKNKNYRIYAFLLAICLILPSNLVFATNDSIGDTGAIGEEGPNDIEPGVGGEDNSQTPENPGEDTGTGEGDNTGTPETPEEGDNQESPDITVDGDMGNIDEGMMVVPEGAEEEIIEEIVAPAVWDGSTDTTWYTNDKTTYEISTAAQLAGLAELVNNGNHMTDITFLLTSDIYLNDDGTPEANEWPMIGESTGTNFRGSIDGQNHTIYNIYVNESTYSYSGFIGQATHLEPLKNIFITGSITNTNSGTSQAGVIGYVGDSVKLDNITNKANIKAKQAGGIVTEVSNLVIKNCRNEGTILATEGNAGGILGYSYISTEMVNCHNIGDVTGKQFTGGLIGHGGSMFISNSTNNANITGNGYHVGGLVGEAKGSKNTVQITNSTTQGSVKGWGNVGGIIGNNSGGFISNCQNLGGTVDSHYYNAGGIVGYQTVNASFQVENWGSVVGCTNKANITTGTDETHSNKAGGIIGSSDRMNSLEDCVNEGSVTAPIKIAGGIIGSTDQVNSIQDCVNRGIVISGTTIAGGIIGQGNVPITGCKNSGEIKANNGNLAGGIRGYGKGIIDGCENSGNVTATGDYVGGINGDDPVAAITNCKNTGNIIGNNWVGGIAGANSISITDSTNSGSVSGYFYTGGIVGQGVTVLEGCSNLGGIVTGVYYTGGIIGQSPEAVGAIKDCINKATVNGNEYTGGIVAYVKGAKSITGCVNEGEIKVNENSNILASRFGGIAGYTNNQVKIENCENKGIIRSNGNWTGGIAGSTGAQITNCKNSGKMYFYALDDTNGTQYLQIGQIVGWSNGNITSCINEGELEVILKADYYTINSGTKGVDYNIGGISGNSENGMITDCINRGKIYVTRNNMTKTRYHNYSIGGIAGYSYKEKIEKSYNLGQIHIDDPIGITDIYDQLFVGGIVAKASTNSIINECINAGELRSKVRNTRIGGIASTAMSSNVTNCISAGDFYNEIGDFIPMAGIVYEFNNGNSSGKLENSYFSGRIHIIDNDTREKVAGITAHMFTDELIKNAYYDMDTLGYDVIAAPVYKDSKLDTDIVKGLHTSEMVGEAAKTYMTNFDFTNMWIMPEDKIAKDDNMRYYPSLRSKPDLKFGIKYYLVTFNNKGYDAVISDPYDITGFVLPTNDFEFKLNIHEAYKDSAYVVKDNGIEINPIDESGVYKLTNIEADHKITVVFEKYPEIDPEEPEEPGNPDNPGDSGNPSNPDRPVNPVRPNIPGTIYLPYIKDHLLGDVELPNGWTWLEPDTIVQVGTHTYKASFHDPNGKYIDLNGIDLTIVMEEEVIIPPVEEPETPDRVVDTSDVRNIALTSMIALLSLLTILIILCKKEIVKK